MADEWKEWEVPPFSHYITPEDQYEVAKGQATIARLNFLSLIPVVRRIDLVLDAVSRGATMVRM